MPKSVIRIAAGILAATLVSLAHSQDRYPTRPIRIVVGYSAGGGNDIIARLISVKMSEGLGQQVIVENRPGASGNIGAAAAAQALPDGYTLHLGGQVLAVNVTLAPMSACR